MAKYLHLEKGLIAVESQYGPCVLVLPSFMTISDNIVLFKFSTYYELQICLFYSPFYSPDVAPTDFQIFREKELTGWKHFCTNIEFQASVKTWIMTQANTLLKIVQESFLVDMKNASSFTTMCFKIACIA